MTTTIDRIVYRSGGRLMAGQSVTYTPDGEPHARRYVVTGIDPNGAQVVVWIGHMGEAIPVTDMSRIGCEIIEQDESE